MIRILLTPLFVLMLIGQTRAQITGSDTVCPDYVYIYNATIAGADSFYWSIPSGWYVLSGQGTSQAEFLCNADTGQVCVTGFDSLGNFLIQYCMGVVWGGATGGWQVVAYPGMCPCEPWNVVIQPNGTGGNCGSCGNGVQSSNFAFGVYLLPWPTGSLFGFVDGSSFGEGATYYVYLIDTTFGINNAFLVSGGICGGTVSNVVSIPICPDPYFTISFTSNQDSICPGDTFTVYSDAGGNFIAWDWSATSNIVILDSLSQDSMVAFMIDTAALTFIHMEATDFLGCPGHGNFWLQFGSCIYFPIASVISGMDSLCGPGCIDFISTSQYSTGFQLNFSGAIPDTSTAINPTNICYSLPGSYDVTLIATNANGSDTLTLHNYITVYPQPAAQSIIQSGDTLFAIAGSASYQWYSNNIIINGATDYFYVASQSGNYNVIVTDSNGCEVEAVINNVIAGSCQSAVGNWQLAIFPNPIIETLNIHGLKDNTADKIEIFNVVGERVFSAVNCQLPIVHCQFSSGIYYLEITTGEKAYRTKFLKQ